MAEEEEDLVKHLKIHPNTKRRIPFFRIYHNMFDQTFCDQLIKQIESTNEYDQSFLENFENNRKNLRIKFKDSHLSTIIFDKVKSFIPSLLDNHEIVKLNDWFRFCKYETEDFFGKHIDFSHEVDEFKSLLTVMIYLNDDFKGGETRFMELDYPYKTTISIKPRTGDIIIFEQDDNRLFHEGCKVESGIKYILRTDALYQQIFSN